MDGEITGAHFNEQTGGSAHAHTHNGKYPGYQRLSFKDEKDEKNTQTWGRGGIQVSLRFILSTRVKYEVLTGASEREMRQTKTKRR